MNIGKIRVSFAKLTGRRGICRSDPSDPDLAAQIKRVCDLILRVGCGSGGPGSSARGGGGAIVGLELPAAVRKTKLTGVRQNGVPGVKSTGV